MGFWSHVRAVDSNFWQLSVRCNHVRRHVLSRNARTTNDKLRDLWHSAHLALLVSASQALVALLAKLPPHHQKAFQLPLVLQFPLPKKTGCTTAHIELHLIGTDVNHSSFYTGSLPITWCGFVTSTWRTRNSLTCVVRIQRPHSSTSSSVHIEGYPTWILTLLRAQIPRCALNHINRPDSRACSRFRCRRSYRTRDWTCD